MMLFRLPKGISLIPKIYLFTTLVFFGLLLTSPASGQATASDSKVSASPTLHMAQAVSAKSSAPAPVSASTVPAADRVKASMENRPAALGSTSSVPDSKPEGQTSAPSQIRMQNANSLPSTSAPSNTDSK